MKVNEEDDLNAPNFKIELPAADRINPAQFTINTNTKALNRAVEFIDSDESEHDSRVT